MIADSKQTGRRMFLAGMVKLEQFNFPFFYFLVKSYRCKYDIKKFTFSRCECVHGSFFGVNKPEERCKHEWACLEWIKENAQKTIKESKEQRKLNVSQ